MHKKSRVKGLAPIGRDLVKMLDSLAHRGTDSTGFTVAGEDFSEDLIVRIWTDLTDGEDAVLARVSEAIGRAGGVVGTSKSWGGFLRLTVNYEGEDSVAFFPIHKDRRVTGRKG